MGKKSKSTTGPSKFAQPYISNAANAVQGAYQDNAGAISDIASQIQGYLPDLGARAFGDNPLVSSAQNYAQGVVGGDYLNGNPYLEQMIANTNNSVGDAVNAKIGTRGGAGGSAQAAILARELAKAETGLRYNDYSSERDRMQQAAGMAPSLAAAEYAGIAPYLAAAGAGAEIPFTGVNALASGITGLLGNSTTTTSKQGLGGALLQGLGAAAGAYAASDRRLKRFISKVGELADGLGVYRWTYVWGGERQTGVMADEVAELRPWALGPEIEGYATVNYAQLPEFA